MVAAFVLLVAVTVLIALPVWTERHDEAFAQRAFEHDLRQQLAERDRLARVDRIHQRYVA